MSYGRRAGEIYTWVWTHGVPRSDPWRVSELAFAEARYTGLAVAAATQIQFTSLTSTSCDTYAEYEKNPTTPCNLPVIQHSMSISLQLVTMSRQSFIVCWAEQSGACYQKQTGVTCENIRSTLLHGFPSIRSVVPLKKHISLITVYR